MSSSIRHGGARSVRRCGDAATVRISRLSLVSLVTFICFRAPSNAHHVFDAFLVAADGLVERQLDGSAGDLAGSWGEPDFTGPSVSGLANAFHYTGVAAYAQSAEAGGQFILSDAGYGGAHFAGFYGDGAYALTRLSAMSATPGNNAWRNALEFFYTSIADSGGTAAYISHWQDQEATSAVYDLANHTLAAYYVASSERDLWRDGVIEALARVDDNTGVAPVMALGATVWALAQVGSMDGRLVDPDAAEGTFWHAIRLRDLPDMLAGRQVQSGDGDGAFFTSLDSADDGFYTETTVMGTLGLLAVHQSGSFGNYRTRIGAAHGALSAGVGIEGEVHWRIADTSTPSYHYLAGETLMTMIPEPGTLIVLLIIVAGLSLCRTRRQRT